MTFTLEFEKSSTDAHTRRALSEISLVVAKSKRIVLVTGAGISCSCGIPDFRSSDGLYNMVKQQYPDVVLKGRDLFDASLFRDATSTAVFYTFISKLKSSIDKATPSPTHHFIKTLDNKKKLLRSYTQNIDGLEARVGLLSTSCQDAKTTGKGKYKLKTKDIRSVQLHGDIHRVRCMSCSAEYPCTDEHILMFSEGTPPDCPDCLSRFEARVARAGRPIRIGSLRPAIVLYDEPHPLGDDIGAIQTLDVSKKPDLLIIMGTSLRVHGLKKLVKEFAKVIRSSGSSSTSSTARKLPKVIFINKTAPGPEWAEYIDCHVAGETDVWVNRVISDWKKMRPVDWELQQTLPVGDGDVNLSGGFKTVKSNSTSKPGIKAGSKQPHHKNLAPERKELTDVSCGGNNSIVPLPSQNKRRQVGTHYYNIEMSPSKRRGASPKKNMLRPHERKMLFTESTNCRPQPDHIQDHLSASSEALCDLSMHDLQEYSKRRRRIRANVSAAGKSKAKARTAIIESMCKKPTSHSRRRKVSIPLT